MTKILLLASMLAVTCNSEPPTKQPPNDARSCAAACEHFRSLGCPEGSPDELGNTCETICERTQAAGLIDLNPDEVLKSDSCSF